MEPDVIEIDIAALDVRYGRVRLPQPRVEEAMAGSMRRFGQVSALIGCLRGESYALVDGFKRLHAAKALGLATLRLRPLLLTERAALAAVYGLNRGNRGLVDLEEALVVRELVRTQGMTQPEVGELLGRHKSWVCRRLMLVERLDEKVQQDVRVGLVPVSIAREVVRLPRGNQAELAETVHRNALTSREAATLVTLFEGTSDRREQCALLDAPRDALAAHRGDAPKNHHDPRLGPGCNALRRQAAFVLEGLARLDRQVHGVETAGWTDAERGVLAPILRQVAGLASRTAVNVLAVAAAMEGGNGAGR